MSFGVFYCAIEAAPPPVSAGRVTVERAPQRVTPGTVLTFAVPVYTGG